MVYQTNAPSGREKEFKIEDSHQKDQIFCSSTEGTSEDLQRNTTMNKEGSKLLQELVTIQQSQEINH